MKKYFTFFLFFFLLSLYAHAERICTQWITETMPSGDQRTRCAWWSNVSSPSEQPADTSAANCEWQTVTDRFGNKVQACVPVKNPALPYTCKVWKTAVLKNGSRQSFCSSWLYKDTPSTQRIICREFVSGPLSEKLAKKQKEAWLSECSKFDTEENGKFCLLWKHEYQTDGTVISRCDKYQLDNEAGLFVSVWADYIGMDSGLKPVASIAEYFAEDEKYPCQEYTGSKMDKKQGKYTVTCTRYATADTLPAPKISSKNTSKKAELEITLPAGLIH